MKLFGQIVRTLVETVILPVDVVCDVFWAPMDIPAEGGIGHRTKERLEKIKDASEEES